jgi:hypothetical protein
MMWRYVRALEGRRVPHLLLGGGRCDLLTIQPPHGGTVSRVHWRLYEHTTHEAPVTDKRFDHDFPGDTSREALRAQYAALRRMTVAQRLAMMDGLTRLVRSMAREGLRRRHPEASETELDERFERLVLGEELATLMLEHRRARTKSPAR